MIDPGVVLYALVTALDKLMADSQGVYGLHANGDFAPWSTLMMGGECSDHIGPVLEAARKLVYDHG